MIILRVCNKLIEYSFYTLFFLVPLALWPSTSELFELNKIWVTWIITIIIGVSWFTKMILKEKFDIQRTPFDIPIALFVASQIISTLISQDTHMSFFGYYSRFNGGLLSTLTYVFLFYAFVTNFALKVKVVTNILLVSLLSGAIVALWGLPSHFGYDPTCLLFRGNFDVSCWTADFMPKVRIFSTLGQPDWLAAYLVILIPIALSFGIINHKFKIANHKQIQNYNNQNPKHFEHSENWNLFGAWNLKFIIFTVLIALFYVDLLFTRARSGILGIWAALILFALSFVWIEKRKIFHKPLTINYQLLIIPAVLLIITFVIGTPFAQLSNFTLSGFKGRFERIKTQSLPEKTPLQDKNAKSNSSNQTVSGGPLGQSPPKTDEGGTESADIRLHVWKGAINAWRANPLFGTGVETFAFAFYKYKPPGHNLTSEWNFLYNKAHNEYLNYLATTGLFGLGSYLLMIGYFLFPAFNKIFKSKSLISNQDPNPSPRGEAGSPRFAVEAGKSQLGQLEIGSIRNLILALIASYISILIINFFGFSVVIVNIYLFLIPAFVLILGNMLKVKITPEKAHEASVWQWTPIFLISVCGLYLISLLFRFWRADIKYAYGYGLDRASKYQEAQTYLQNAIKLRNEPVFRDELSINSATLAVTMISQSKKDDQGNLSLATNLAQEAVNISNILVLESPKNIMFWKSRAKIFYTISQVDPHYLPRSLEAIEKAYELAPNDANVLYNLGVLYGQNNKIQKGIGALEKTVKLKPDYTDARYALGLFYHTLALDEKTQTVKDWTLNKKAIEQLQYILNYINPNRTEYLETIKNWSI